MPVAREASLPGGVRRRPPSTPVEVRSADGTRLHAEIYGPEDAPTIVLSHGITCQIKVWKYQIATLAPTYRVVAYDHRGHGRSARPPDRDAYSVRALAEDLHAVLAECVPGGERAVLAGHSMGGIAIMAWAQQYPDEVERRVAAAALVNTAANGILTDAGGYLPPGARSVATWFALTGAPTPIFPGTRSAMRYLVFGRNPRRADVELLGRIVNACPARTRASFARSLMGMDLLPGLGTLTVPTRVIGGAVDRLLPIVHSTHIAGRLPNLIAFETLPGVGHMGQFEADGLVAQRLADLADTYLGDAS